MNGESILTLVLAVCCIAAAGVTATTLESSLAEDPEDVIDISYDDLPLGQDEAGDVKKATDRKEDEQNSAGSATGSGEGGDREDTSAGTEGSGGSPNEGTGPKDAEGGGDDGDGQQSGGGDGTDSDGVGGSGDQDGSGSGEGTTMGMGERIVEPAKSLLPYLLAALAALILAALAYRYRKRILALLLAVAGVFGTDDSRRGTDRPNWPRERPESEVHRAWLTMVERLNLDRPYARTPSECARAAERSDLNPDAVRTLTAVFEEVRYGNVSETDEHRKRARDGLRRLDGGGSA